MTKSAAESKTAHTIASLPPLKDDLRHTLDRRETARRIGSPMQIERVSPAQLLILAPAKVNLFLEVIERRADGFHEIESLMCPVSLFDRLTIEVIDGEDIEFDLICPQERRVNSNPPDPAWSIPATPDNLVVRAVKAAREMLEIRRGCRIQLEKQIPASAGLGGGSSDAAAAIVGYLALTAGWNREFATELCSRLGSDIPFFMGDLNRIGLALATGRGERCSLLSFAPELEFVITHPMVGCATGEVYARHQRQEKRQTSERIVEACKTGQFQKIGAVLFNALQFAASEVNPWITRQLELLAECGFTYSLMSGSGSSCFAITNETIKATKIEQRAREIGISRIFTASSWYAPPIEEQLHRIRNDAKC